MTSGWTTTRLGKFVNLKRGYDLPTSKRNFGHVPVIGSAGLTGYHDKAKVKGPGVTVGRSGASIGHVTYSHVDFWPHNAALYVTDFYGNDVRFAYYFLKSMDFENYNSGSAQPSLNRNFIHQIVIKVPPLPIQQRIAAVLSAYDDLIENNQRRIAALEAAAQALYREWFVEMRFPGWQDVEWVEGELGVIPAGWEVATLGQIARQERRSVQPNEVAPETPYVGLGHIPQCSIALTEWGEAQETVSTKLVFNEGEILFAKIRPYLHKVVFAPLDGVCSSDTIVINPIERSYYGLVLMITSSVEFINYADTTSKGTSMPRADWDAMVEYPIALPPEKLLLNFNEFLEDVTGFIQASIFRNRALRETRDLLLPRLISGEVSVEELPLPEEVVD
ncbi:MAG: restriction endonuclease subunit S [Anaerolineae bacterium]|nr:restriction endonuclease subunit S [Anaerolineae bacterium]